MSAFPVDPTQLQLVRDNLRLEARKLLATIANITEYVEALERDRLPLDEGADEAYDAARLPLAQNLLAQLQAETSDAPASFVFRVKTSLGLK